MQVFLNACDDQKDSHNKEIISTFNQQIIFPLLQMLHRRYYLLWVTLSQIFQKNIIYEHNKRKKENQRRTLTLKEFAV